MVEMLRLAGALLAGCILGACFFVGLWWTVQKGVAVEHPGTFFLGSMLLRTLIVMAGFYCIARGDWRMLAASLTGFALARFLMTRWLGPSPQPKPFPRLGEVR